MTLISASCLGKSYGARICFGGASFTLSRGVRVGLIGPNGCGKTTFLKILADQEDFEGSLTRRRNIEIAFLEQSPRFSVTDTPRSIMADATAPWRALDSEIEHLRESLSGLTGDDMEDSLAELSRLESRRETVNVGAHRSEALLHGVGLEPDRLDRPLAELSGGERRRAALARLLLSEPDVWLLDEPTNHLDLSGIAFLERFLLAGKAAAIIVSHDRRFLDRLTSTTWEMEDGKLVTYPGNYSQSRRLREERRQAAWKTATEQKEFIRRQQEFIDKWRAGTRSRQAQSRQKRLDKLERVDSPAIQAGLGALDLKLSRRLGDLVLETRNLSVGYPSRTLFQNLNLSLRAGEVLGIVGANGCGKTTFLKTITGELAPVAGSYRWGPTAELGGLGQHDEFPDESRSPMEFLQDNNLGADDRDRRDKLGGMLFSGDEATDPIKRLSGGERKRLMLTRLLLSGHNVLLMDEPTNHLDVRSAEVVTLALSAYPGSVIVVSHDRHFLDEVADRILWLDDGGFRLTIGGFTEADAAREKAIREKEEQDEAKEPVKRNRAPQRSGEKKSDSPYSSWRTGKIEDAIIKIETRIAEIHELFMDPAMGRDPDAARGLKEELTSIEAEQVALEAEYARR